MRTAFLSTLCVSALSLAGCTNLTLDLCPDDPAKMESGACGCGVADSDLDGDGVPDCFKMDLCPTDDGKTQPGVCGCGVADTDADMNGVPDCLDAHVDLCPGDPDKTQAGACGCGTSDADADTNGVPDCFDPPPPDPQTFFPKTCLDVQDKVVADTGSRPPDGTYTLYVGGVAAKPWLAYCRHMNLSSPTEYLTVDEDFNVSQISNGLAVASTAYRRYRFDPNTFTINPLDNTFAINTGFDVFTPVLPGTLTFIPAGWAEFQPFRSGDGPPAQAQVSLAGTPFVFNDTILANNLGNFFCSASDAGTMVADTDGSGATVAADLASFTVTATNSDPMNTATGVSTRMVADCADLGPTAVTFDVASWPLVYSGF